MKGKNRFDNPSHTASLLQAAARNSYRLDKCLYEPLTISIASSFNCIKAYETEIKAIDITIEKTIRGFNTTEYQSLLSIPGIGQVYASGILAEIGTISAFTSQDALSKYAGLVWTQNQSGNYKAFYHKKYDEVKTHQHKRALALTSRKLIRLIFGLLDNNQLYSAKRENNNK